MTERLLAPMIDFLAERVGEDSNILCVLERHIRWRFLGLPCESPVWRY